MAPQECWSERHLFRGIEVFSPRLNDTHYLIARMSWHSKAFLDVFRNRIYPLRR